MINLLNQLTKLIPLHMTANLMGRNLRTIGYLLNENGITDAPHEV